MCGILYGFDRTQHLFVMARHFKDILAYFSYIFKEHRVCMYSLNDYFIHTYT